MVAIVFVVKNDDRRNDHKRYKSIYFNYFFTCYYRVRLFLAMQVRVMAACMESQADILECTASAQSSRREVTVCFSPMSMGCSRLLLYLCNGHLSEIILLNINNYYI